MVTYDNSASGILENSRDNLRGGCGCTVGENNQRFAVRKARLIAEHRQSLKASRIADKHHRKRIAAVGRPKEELGEEYRLRKRTASVASKVKDHAVRIDCIEVRHMFRYVKRA